MPRTQETPPMPSRNSYQPATVLIAALLLCSPPARAENSSPVSLSGFGTVGALYNDSDGAAYSRDMSQPIGTAKAKRWSFKPDSMLGVQATARASDDLEATLQLVSRHSLGQSFKPQVAWAFLKYKPVEDVTLRAGRLGIDLYQQGDSAEIGFANLSVRQPIIFYPRAFDGADAEWTTPVGPGMLRLKGQMGLATGKMASGPEPYDAGGSRGKILVVEYAHRAWTARLSAGSIVMKNEFGDADTQALVSALPMAPNGAEILKTFAMKDRKVGYSALGLSYDDGPMKGMISYRIVTSPNVPDLKAFYALAGYRIGQLTPYASYANQRSERRLIPTGIPWGLSPATDALNQAAAVAQTAMWQNQSTTTVGLRYDTSRNTALKFQVDSIRYQDPWTIDDPALLTGDVAARAFKRMTLYSVALEFVF